MTPAAIASPLPPRFAEESSSETRMPKDTTGSKGGKKPKKIKSKKDDERKHEKTKEEETEDGSDPDHTFEGRDDDDDDENEPDGSEHGCRKKPATKGSQDSSSRKKPAAVMKRPASQRKERKACEDAAQACPELTHMILCAIGGVCSSYNTHVLAVFMRFFTTVIWG